MWRRINWRCRSGFETYGRYGPTLQTSRCSIFETAGKQQVDVQYTVTEFIRPIYDVLLDRARGHVVSVKDPVSGGGHCCIGGGKYDFLVTSTLASQVIGRSFLAYSQAPPAVGRALGSHLASANGIPSLFPSDFVSFVTVGDGSVNHTHFLTALNFAEYANFRRYKCPVVFGISYVFTPPSSANPR